MAFNTPRNIGPSDQLLFNADGECVGIQPGGSSSPALFGLTAQEKAANTALVSADGNPLQLMVDNAAAILALVGVSFGSTYVVGDYVVAGYVL